MKVHIKKHKFTNSCFMSSVFHTGNWEIKFMAYISILGNSEMIEEKVILTTISNSTQKMLLEIIWGKYVN